MSGFLGTLGTAASSLTGSLGGFSAPTSQKDRPISFALEDNGAVVAQVTLGLRPEDMSRGDTSRLTVHLTLGGAWADCFGPGLPSINIAGTTGWRGGSDGDGEARWQQLRDQVWNRWHSLRKEAIAAGRDPSQVKLLYADGLANFVVEVAPMAITLRRSKSRPLLIQYQLSLIVLDQNADQLKFLQGGAEGGEKSQDGGFFSSVMESIAEIRAGIAGAINWVNRTLVAPVRAFLTMANQVFSGVIGIVRDTRALVGSVLAVPMMIAQAGANLFRTIAAVASLPLQIKNDVMGVASAFTNVICFLLRSASTRIAYGDYNPFYGASNCSSISGGRPTSPFAGTNPFFSLATPGATGPVVALSDRGISGLGALASSDPVLSPMNDNEIASALADTNAGVTVSAAAA